MGRKSTERTGNPVGRPRIGRRVHLTLDDDLISQLDMYAKALNISMSDLVRRVLKVYTTWRAQR